MLGDDGKRQREQAAAYQSFQHKRQGGRNFSLKLEFGVDLGATTNDAGFSWSTLPGLHTPDWFVARDTFQAIDMSVATSWTQVATWEHKYAAIQGTTANYNGYLTTLSAAATGCCVGILGGWFAHNQNTHDSKVYNVNANGGTESWNVIGLQDLENLVEYNGFLFFKAFKYSVCGDVIGYKVPSIWSNPDRTSELFQYFSIEHLGSCGQVGVYKGQLVVATSSGVWEIKPRGEDGGYALGRKMHDWSLSIGATIAISHNFIVALDNGDLLVMGDGIYPGTRFSEMHSNGKDILLAGATEVAVLNGDGWETFTGYTNLGGALVASSQAYSLERKLRTASTTVTLSTTTYLGPGRIGLQEVMCHPSVTGVVVTTDYGSYTLTQSANDVGRWFAGITGKTMKLDFSVPTGTRITPPILYLEPRSQA